MSGRSGRIASRSDAMRRHRPASPVVLAWVVVACALTAVGAGCGNGGGQAIVYDEPTTTTTGRPVPQTTVTVPESSGPTLGPWVDVTGNLAGMASQCGNLSLVVARPGTDQIIAGVALQGLWVSDGGGGPWIRMDASSPQQIRNRTVSIIFDPSNRDRFWESGSWTGPSVVRTSDGGRTFAALGDVYNVEGLSVDLGDPERRTMLVGSQQRSDLYRSVDGGATWTGVAPPLLPWVFAAHPLVLTDRVHLLGTTSGGGRDGAGIWRSSDGGSTWRQVTAVGVAGPALVARDGTVYWPLQDGRGLVRSTDRGETFTQVTPDGVLSSFNVIELPDGRLGAVGKSYFVVSSDQGLTWRPLGPTLPVKDVYGLTYSDSHDAVYVWRRDCGESVPAGGVQRLDLAPGAP